MAEYIDRKALLELINEDCKYQNPTNEYTRGCNEVCDWAIKTIKNMPAADVVPKSEVEKLEKDNEDLRNVLTNTINKYRNCKVEVSREIFEEIEKALSDNFHADCQMGDCIEDYYDDNLRDDIAELKKKYTENENG